MGAGRKVQTLSMREGIQHSPNANSSVSARNLKTSDLGAVIFGCTHSTMQECLPSQLFGLPAFHLSYVKNIRPGMPLFLFNYSNRKMHGIFEAVGHGQLGINMHGWTDGFEKTPYLAQVRVHLRKQCQPLSEEQYKKILIGNYNGQSHHYWFELDHAQTGALLSLFESFPVPSALTYSAPVWRSLQVSTTNDIKEHEETSNFTQNISFVDSKRKWSSLFKEQGNSDSRNHDESSKSIVSETDCSTLCCNDMDECYSLPMSIALTYEAPLQGTVHQSSNSNTMRAEETLKSTQDFAFSDSQLRWSSHFKEQATGDPRTQEEILKLKIPESDCTQFDYGYMEEWYSSVISECEEENEGTQIPEIHSDTEGMDSEEKRIYLKLKQIAFNRGLLNTSEEYHLEEALVPCMMGETHLKDEFSPEANSTPEHCDMEEAFMCTTDKAHFVDGSFPDAPSVPKECEDITCDSSNKQSVINQLKAELEDLKDLSLDQFRKTSALEKMLVCSDSELQQLRDHVMVLSSQLKNSSTCVSQPLESFFHEPSIESKELQLGMKELIIIMGGCKGDGLWLSTADCYSTSRDIVRCLQPMSSTRSFSSAAALNGYIFNFGGCSNPTGNTIYDTVECYDPWNDEWSPCPPLSERKACLASATFQNKIYAFGGGGGGNCSSKVEMFDPALGRWIVVQPMLYKRYSAAAAELNGALYVVGGYDGYYLNSAERFDPREGFWRGIQSMTGRKGSHSLAVLNGKLYAIGGFDGFGKMVPSVEVFDPRIGSWIMGDEMRQPRGYCFAPVIGETIFVIGGSKEWQVFADTVECYKEGRGWSVTDLKGLGERTFFSAALV